MKPRILVLLSAFATLSYAQRPEIIGLTSDGTLTWTNTASDGYYGLESTLDLTFVWYPHTTATWNQMISNSVQSCAIDTNIFGLGTPIPKVNDLIKHPYFRIVVSSNQLALPAVVHSIRLVNRSSGSISNVVVGAIAHSAHASITNVAVLLPFEATDWAEVATPFSFFITMSCSGTECHPSDGWYVSYQQNGHDRLLEAPMTALGPSRTEIVGFVNNDSITTTWTWLDLTDTREW